MLEKGWMLCFSWGGGDTEVLGRTLEAGPEGCGSHFSGLSYSSRASVTENKALVLRPHSQACIARLLNRGETLTSRRQSLNHGIV